MESTKQKQKLQFLPEEDDEQERYGLGDSKRPRMDDDDGDEIAEFFALMDRIRATNKILKQKHAIFDPAQARSSGAGNIEGKFLTSKSPWKPSFEWEDFCYGNMHYGGDFRSSNVWRFANNTASASNEIRKPGIRSDEGCKVCSSDKYMPVGSFDLNAEAPSDHPVPWAQ